jgi:uncharacterized protein (TIGR03435 family)
MRSILPLLLCATGFAQEFDVASIKLKPPLGGGAVPMTTGRRGGPGTDDPTHMTWTTSLVSVLLNAYNIKAYQLESPEWTRSDQFEFAVVVPDRATPEQLREMWRNLLLQRFGLKVRVEKKSFEVSEIVTDPRGHKLIVNTEPSPDPANRPVIPSGGLKMDGNGRPILPAGMGMLTLYRSGPTGTTAQLVAKGQTIAQLVTLLEGELVRPVVDKTGLTGKYDFNLDYTPSGSRFPVPPPPGAGAAPTSGAGPAPIAEVGVDLEGALRQQLGLRLNKAKADLDYIIVEKLERTPTVN